MNQAVERKIRAVKDLQAKVRKDHISQKEVKEAGIHKCLSFKSLIPQDISSTSYQIILVAQPFFALEIQKCSLRKKRQYYLNSELLNKQEPWQYNCISLSQRIY